MGDFFTSPREAAASNLYESAIKGKPIGESFLRNEATLAKQQLRQRTSDITGGISGDVLSRLASIGVSPGSSSEALISKATNPILAGEQQSEAGIDTNLQGVLANLLLNELNTGLSGLSASSTFGNILAGLQTVGNLATGGVNLYNALKSGDQINTNFGSPMKTSYGGAGTV